GGNSPLRRVAFLVLIAGPLAWLAVWWWRWKEVSPAAQKLIWAATITGTLVINLYVGVYDSVLAVLGMLLTADVLARERGKEGTFLPPGFRLLLFLLYLTPWLSQPLARVTHIQMYTLVLAAAAAYPLVLLRSERDARTMTPTAPEA